MDGNASKTVYPPVSLRSLGGYNKKTLWKHIARSAGGSSGLKPMQK